MVPLPYFESIEKWMVSARDTGGLRLNPWLVFFLGILIFFDGYLFFKEAMDTALEFALFVSPVWVAALMLVGSWELWMIMQRSYFIASLNYILLEIKPPRTIIKTPLAMETVLAGLHHSPGESNWFQLYVQGKVRPWWSLEIASLEGQIHFYIWTRANFRKLIESAIYAQYPGAQVVEVEDYTKKIAPEPGEGWGVWGCDYKETQSSSVYPIKTYLEYGLDKIQEEPEQVDPLANIIEFMSSIGKGEYLWVQFIARVHSGRDKYHGEKNAAGKDKTWKDEAKEVVDKMRKAARSPYTDPATGKEMPGFPNATKHETDTMAAIERNVSKLAFDVGARAMYLSRQNKFDPINITGMIGLFKAFSSEGWNGIKGTRWGMEYSDYPWELGNTKRKNHRFKEMIQAYRRRQYFYEPFAFHDYMTMSTEELATVYHIPSRAVESPALPRIESATGEAPTNLPT